MEKEKEEIEESEKDAVRGISIYLLYLLIYGSVFDVQYLVPGTVCSTTIIWPYVILLRLL